jgi:hypothetical protein
VLLLLLLPQYHRSPAVAVAVCRLRGRMATTTGRLGERTRPMRKVSSVKGSLRPARVEHIMSALSNSRKAWKEVLLMQKMPVAMAT